MSKMAIEVITSVQRRRRWSAARRSDWCQRCWSLVPASLRWRARPEFIGASHMDGGVSCPRPQLAPQFAAVRIAADPGSAGQPGTGMIEVEFPKSDTARRSTTVSSDGLHSSAFSMMAGVLQHAGPGADPTDCATGVDATFILLKCKARHRQRTKLRISLADRGPPLLKKRKTLDKTDQYLFVEMEEEKNRHVWMPWFERNLERCFVSLQDFRRMYSYLYTTVSCILTN
jgi:hypothetical protein